MDKIKEFFNSDKLIAELIRFAIVGGIATLIDMIVMSVVIYCFQPYLYPNFLDVFFNSEIKPSDVSAIVGTGVGFIAGLIFNYFLSVVFVFNEKGQSKTAKGMFLFAFFSVIGLFIHIGGMYLLFTVLHINEWIVKILLTAVVLVYNYAMRKIFIFKNVNKETEGAYGKEE